MARAWRPIEIKIKDSALEGIAQRPGETPGTGRKKHAILPSLALLGMLAIFLGFCGSAKSAWARQPVQASLVADAVSGEVLSASNPDALTYPASLTKMMTLYLLFDALKKGEIKLNDRITFSANAAGKAPTNLRTSVGNTILVETAILAVIVRSANDVATAIAEKISGSETAFAARMTAKARQLGMTRTVFKNPSGLPDPDQRTTARDMAVLGIALLRDFPDYYGYFARNSFTYQGVLYTGHNRLLKQFPGADGIKTGYVNASGFNLVTSAERNGRRLVGVVLGGETSGSRDRKMATIMTAAFKKPGSQGKGIMLAAKAPDSVRGGAGWSAPTAGPDQAEAVLLASNQTPLSAAPSSAITVKAPAKRITITMPTKPATQGNIDQVIASLNAGTDVAQAGIGDSDAEDESSDPAAAAATASIGANDLSTMPTPARTKKTAPSLKATDQKAGQKKANQNAGQKPKLIAAQKAPDPQNALPVWKQGDTFYGIQVGAYSTYASANKVARRAAERARILLADARVMIDETRDAKGAAIYRARVIGLNQDMAANACRKLRTHQMNCMIVKTENTLAQGNATQ